MVITGSRFRWPSGIVPYDIDPNLPDQQRITIAIGHWESNTPIRFILRNNANAPQFPNYVRFIRGEGCSSPAGMQGNGRQNITLAGGCDAGRTIHEIGHAGLWHEQSREDRDNFVSILWENIQTDKRHNFNQHITDGDDIGEYDYCSIMHYSTTAFSANNRPTIQVLQPTRSCGNSIGQRDGLSIGDIAAIRAIYPFTRAVAVVTWA